MTNINDPLWPHFKPLWLDFETAEKNVLVAGGYGLFLKQQWLLASSDLPIVVPFERWTNTVPRATADMDLIVSLDLISDEVANKQLFEALDQQGFEVSRELHGKRWQFFKEVGKDHHVVVELHAPMPEGEVENLTSNRFAVKHKPSLGEQGIHGRTNQEAIGSDLHFFQFEMEDIQIAVPNPVAWTVMKLTAAEDTWKRSEEVQREPEDRKFFRKQAIKHGNDVCRSVALMTIGERDLSAEVVEAIKDTPQFIRAADIYRDFFTGKDDWAREVLKDQWLQEDLDVIHYVLASWY